MRKTDKWESSLNLFKRTLVLLGTYHLPPGTAGLHTLTVMPSANNSVKPRVIVIVSLDTCSNFKTGLVRYVPDLSDGQVSDVPSCLTWRPLAQTGSSSHRIPLWFLQFLLRIVFPLESLNIPHLAGICLQHSTTFIFWIIARCGQLNV
jgi:hypothetical protein